MVDLEIQKGEGWGTGTLASVTFTENSLKMMQNFTKKGTTP